MVQYILMFVAILSGSIEAHQFTPTYPELSGSYVKGISSANMQLFNRRNDASYYEIGVFDKDWNKVPFATPTKIIRVDYLKTVKFDVFIRNKDKSRAVYVCTKSKLIVDGSAITSVSSRICSKFR